MSLEEKFEALEARVAELEQFKADVEAEKVKWRREGGVATAKFVNNKLSAAGIRATLTRRG